MPPTTRPPTAARKSSARPGKRRRMPPRTGLSTPMRQPGDGHAVLVLETFLPYRLSVLSNTLSQGIARSYERRHGLSVTEWRLLAVLGRFPGISANELAERTAMDKVAVSRALAKLLAAGRIERDLHAGDRRRSVLQLSAAGYAIYDDVAPRALAYEAALLAALSDEERIALHRLLDKLADAHHPAADVHL
jgi:DNA-binding MarR family transcriptional regulator